MRVAYIDGNAGVSGDMMLGALVDAGWPIEELKEIPVALGLSHVDITRDTVKKKGITGTKIEIHIPHEHAHRGLSEIIGRIESSGLEKETCRRAISVFRNIAAAEAEVHGVPVEEIHFHEVGAVDAMVDVVGTCRGLVRLGIEKVILGPLRLGCGTVHCAHGELPVPAPATAKIIRGIPVFAGECTGEWTTPTGAALAMEWANEFGTIPKMAIESEGWGAGQADPVFPNLLRLVIGREEEGLPKKSSGQVVVLETEIDDMQGEYYSYLHDKLAEIPVRDYYLTPVMMKKNRPGQQITVIADHEKVDRVVKVLFAETSTFGVRIRETQRFCMERKFVVVTVESKEIRVKVGTWEGEVMRISPEYEDCRKVAEETGIPLDGIYFMARNEAKKLLNQGGI